MEKKSKKLLTLFLTFLKIGAFTFGGGYAMIPLIQREIVENKKWLSDDDILEIIAISESTPGPIAINSATFVGYRTCGVLGSVAATLGVVLPSFVIIFAISFVLLNLYWLFDLRFAKAALRKMYSIPSLIIACLGVLAFLVLRNMPLWFRLFHMFRYLISIALEKL